MRERVLIGLLAPGLLAIGAAGALYADAPSVTAVLDAGSYTPAVAPGSVFVVKGTNLSDPGVTESSFPLPPSTGGVSIAFTSPTGGSSTLAYILYLYNQDGVNQLAAVLPSTVTLGSYNVTVTNSGAVSEPVLVNVVGQKPALFTQDSTGSGLVVMQNYISPSQVDVNRFTTGSANGATISPAHPGQVLIAWLTGLGPVPFADNSGAPAYNFQAAGVDIQVLVGGMAITPGYAGSAPGSSGEDQIDFTLPANVPTGCTVPFQISENGVLSQTTFLSIAPDATSTACVQPGYTTAQLQALDQGATVSAGAFTIIQSSESLITAGAFSAGSAYGSFTQYTGFELAAIPVPGSATPAACTVAQTPGSAGAAGAGLNLDAGELTLTGPSGSHLNRVALNEANNLYNFTISGPGSTVDGNIVAGTYTLSGAGGTGVGAFQAAVNLTPLAVTGGLPSAINRSAGLTVNWTGGNPADVVVVNGYSVTIANGVSSGAQFTCSAIASAQTLTVDASILSQLPAVTAADLTSGTASAYLSVTSNVSLTAGDGLFNAPLTAGGSIVNATFQGTFGTSVTPAYQ